MSADRNVAEQLRDENIQRLTDLKHNNKISDIPECKVEEYVIQSDFEVPPEELPRSRYHVKSQADPYENGWPKGQHEIHHIGDDGVLDKLIASVTRNYSGFPCEFFRQGDKDFALISPDYTGTSVLDLQTGEIIAAEPHESWGFCPVGFYVPDWWDVHDGSILPGSLYWNESEDTEPSGKYGFVWGCVWGDNSSWKVEYLDLSEIQHGVIRRDDRFGYVDLATGGYFHNASDNPPPFIRVSKSGSVEFYVENTFKLSGEKIWPRDNS